MLFTRLELKAWEAFVFNHDGYGLVAPNKGDVPTKVQNKLMAHGGAHS